MSEVPEVCPSYYVRQDGTFWVRGIIFESFPHPNFPNVVASSARAGWWEVSKEEYEETIRVAEFNDPCLSGSYPKGVSDENLGQDDRV